MAAGGIRAAFDLVRIQKLLFLVDREIPHLVGGPHFRFKPYHYGPFDKAVYNELTGLVQDQHVVVDHSGPYPLYSLTESGNTEGESILARAGEQVVSYLRCTANWVLLTSFRRLVAAIYEKHPDMATRSRMRFSESRYVYPAIRSSGQAFVRGFGRAFDLTHDIDDGISTWLDPSSDFAAMYEDWAVVGNGLKSAMGAIRVQQRQDD